MTAIKGIHDPFGTCRMDTYKKWFAIVFTRGKFFPFQASSRKKSDRLRIILQRAVRKASSHYFCNGELFKIIRAKFIHWHAPAHRRTGALWDRENRNWMFEIDEAEIQNEKICAIVFPDYTKLLNFKQLAENNRKQRTFYFWIFVHLTNLGNALLPVYETVKSLAVSGLPSA